MRKTITAALLSAGLILGGTGVASANGGDDAPDAGSSSGSVELLKDKNVQKALIQLLISTGSAATGANSGSGTAN